MKTFIAALTANAGKNTRLGRCALTDKGLHEQIELLFAMRIRRNASKGAIFCPWLASTWARNSWYLQHERKTKNANTQDCRPLHRRLTLELSGGCRDA